MPAADSTTLRFEENPLQDPARARELVVRGPDRSPLVNRADEQPSPRAADAAPAEDWPSPSRASGAPAYDQPAEWEELFAQARDAKAYRAKHERARDAAQQELEAFTQWSERAVRRLMVDLLRGAQARAEEFKARTGQTIQVTCSSNGPVPCTDTGDRDGIRFLRLELGESLLHIYSSCSASFTTQLHFLPSRTDSLRRNHRLVSAPGAFVVRRADDSYELRSLRGDKTRGAGRVMAIDDLLFQAFRLLLAVESDKQRLKCS